MLTIHTLHINFICRTKLQIVESSVHSGVVWINQTPDIHIKPVLQSIGP
ncbi:hypothetical protein NC652_018120 [Populus alba x Populus x berolinensis]|nr:hypothetical protein NC652_018120 [Populus alba x Populus x berolinensis]